MRLRLLGAVLGLAGPFRYLAGVAVDEKDVETMAVCRRSGTCSLRLADHGKAGDLKWDSK